MNDEELISPRRSEQTYFVIRHSSFIIFVA